MGKLFKIEMKKMWKSTAMRVMFIVTTSLSLFSVAIYSFVENLADDGMGALISGSGYTVLNDILIDNSDSMLFTVLFIAIFIGSDFNGRTLQSQISAGYSRLQIILSRYLSTIIAFLIFYFWNMFLMVGGTTIVLGFGRELTGKLAADLALKIFMSVFMSISMLTIYQLICFLVKSTGASIGISLPFITIGVASIQLLSIVFETCEKIVSFTPFGQIMLVTNKLDGMGYFKFFAVGIIWLVGVLCINFITFRKSELK